ncbi:CHASE3 domain-containing protein [Caballeronia sp. BR00000012568055]|uniref:CHASE3 domain-containing protein n=1 Tax=Caballeronia sp. BR00000012568055 TaxID=2918761 RepID=UPI0023F746A5|nr:CHASE3 domain-containing protein [Caballeronia sp. BR00000012568055]
MQRWHSFDWRVVPLIALVLVTSGTSFGYHRILLAQRDWIEHTYQVLSALESTLQLITDAETGQRGYILTGKSTYLAPYRQAVQTVQSLPSRLRQLVKDSPTQLNRVHELELALDAKLEELQQTLATLDTQGLTSARAMVLSDVGREHMDRIRALISQMRSYETDLLAARTARASRLEHQMLVITIFLAALSIGVRIALYRRAVRTRMGVES